MSLYTRRPIRLSIGLFLNLLYRLAFLICCGSFKDPILIRCGSFKDPKPPVKSFSIQVLNNTQFDSHVDFFSGQTLLTSYRGKKNM